MPKNSENLVEIIDELKQTNTRNSQAFMLQLDEINRKLEDIGDGKEFVFVRNALTDMRSSLNERFSEITEAINGFSSEIQNDSQNDILELLNEKFSSLFTDTDKALSGLADKLAGVYDKFKLETGEKFSELKETLSQINEAFSLEKLEISEMAKNSDAKSEKLSASTIQSVKDLNASIKELAKGFADSINKRFDFVDKSIGASNNGQEIIDAVENNFGRYCVKINEISDLIINLKKEIDETGSSYKKSSEVLSTSLNELGSDLQTMYSNLSEDLKNELNLKIENCQKFIARNTDAYSEQVVSIGENLKLEFQSLQELIRDKFAAVADSVDKSSALFEKSREFFDEFVQKVEGIAGRDYTENFDELLDKSARTHDLVEVLHTKVDSLLNEVSEKDENVSAFSKHLSDLEEKISSMSLTMSESQDEKILELNYEIEDLIKNLDSKFNDIKKSDIADISNMVSDISKTFVNFENRINFLMDDIKKSEAESLQDLNSELLNHKNLLEELNAKLDVFVSSDDTELLEDELAEIKEIILAQEEILKSAENGFTDKASSNFKNIIAKIDSVSKTISEHESNSEKIKEDIIDTIVSVLSSTGFTEESEDIKEFVEEKTDELNRQLHDVKSELKNLKETDITDYSYTLNDVEYDMANLRGALKDVTSTTPVTEINQISRNIHNLTSSIDAISKNLTPAEIFQLKHGILKLNDDILSISTRTNKLLMNSDEASKTISDGVQAFGHIAYDLEERIKEFSNHDLIVQMANKIERVLMLSESASGSDATVQKVLMFLGEWVDAVSETIENINTKTDEIEKVSEALSELRKTLPQKAELFDMLEEKFEEQQVRIDRLEAKLDSLTEMVHQNSMSTVLPKLEKVENIVETINNSIEKLTSYVE